MLAAQQDLIFNTQFWAMRQKKGNNFSNKSKKKKPNENKNLEKTTELNPTTRRVNLTNFHFMTL